MALSALVSVCFYLCVFVCITVVVREAENLAVEQFPLYNTHKHTHTQGESSLRNTCMWSRTHSSFFIIFFIFSLSLSNPSILSCIIYEDGLTVRHWNERIPAGERQVDRQAAVPLVTARCQCLPANISSLSSRFCSGFMFYKEPLNGSM